MKEVIELIEQILLTYREGLITDDECFNKIAYECVKFMSKPE